MIDFTGQTVLITGAGQGQGAVQSQLLHSLGATVLVTDVSADRARATAQVIGGSRIASTELDVSSEEHWARSTRLIEEWSGRLDVLINNAGIYLPDRIDSSSAEQLDQMFSVNQRGTYLGVRSASATMRKSGAGTIVNVASVAALGPSERSVLYGMTKAAVVALTKGAAVEYGPDIRVNCVLPGGVDTGMLLEESRAFFKSVPLRRVAEPIEIAKAVAFLASGASSYCTGAILVVDGGWTLGPSRKAFTEVAAAYRDTPQR